MIEVITLRDDNENVSAVTICADGFESTVTIERNQIAAAIASNEAFKALAGNIADELAESCRQELSKWA